MSTWKSSPRRRSDIPGGPASRPNLGGASAVGATAGGSELAGRRRAIGARGEELAAAWYREHGYEILDRNWRCGAGELDVVARRGRTTVFCEVKTRTTVAFGAPAEAVTPAKRARIRRLAARWLASKPGTGGLVRFDVASVLDGRVDLIEAAF